MNLHIDDQLQLGRLDLKPLCAPALLCAHLGGGRKTGLPQTAGNRAYRIWLDSSVGTALHW